MDSAFDPFQGLTFEEPQNQLKQQDDDPFKGISFEEPWYKSYLRTAYQIPSGIAKAVTFPLDIIQMMGVSEATDPENIDLLREIHLREGIPFDEKEYISGVSEAAETFPTQANIERQIEEETGLPLTPKTQTQRLLSLAASAGKFSPGTLPQKIVAAGVAPAVSGGLQATGVPEQIADIAGLVASA